MDTHTHRRKKWLDLYGRRRKKCFICGREPFAKIGDRWRCYQHRNP